MKYSAAKKCELRSSPTTHSLKQTTEMLRHTNTQSHTNPTIFIYFFLCSSLLCQFVRYIVVLFLYFSCFSIQVIDWPIMYQPILRTLNKIHQHHSLRNMDSWWHKWYLISKIFSSKRWIWIAMQLQLVTCNSIVSISRLPLMGPKLDCPILTWSWGIGPGVKQFIVMEGVKQTFYFGRSLPNLFTHPPTPGFCEIWKNERWN